MITTKHSKLLIALVLLVFTSSIYAAELREVTIDNTKCSKPARFESHECGDIGHRPGSAETSHIRVNADCHFHGVGDTKGSFVLPANKISIKLICNNKCECTVPGSPGGYSPYQM